jgi:hypothetical protein
VSDYERAGEGAGTGATVGRRFQEEREVEMTARIYRQSPSVTQSGPGPEKPWRFDYDPQSPRSIEPLMGWTASADMKQQIRLRFATKEEAVAYAERAGVPYRIEEPKTDNASRRTASYSDNFRTNRIGLWTH